MNATIQRLQSPLHGSLQVPGDKSITHRALLLAALAKGESRIGGLLRSRDCEATRSCLQALGVRIVDDGDDAVIVRGVGLGGLRKPLSPIDCVRSATTIRLLAGILCGQRFSSVLTGDAQLLRRPMDRIVKPLSAMGAKIMDSDGHAPLRISGGGLRGLTHRLAVASAQLKSAILLAGLFARGRTTVYQQGPARDHTERLLATIGAAIRIEGLKVSIEPPECLSPFSLQVPGDISSAAFPLVAALLLPGSQIRILSVGLNPTRTGLLDVLIDMGARIEIENRRVEGDEPVGDLTIRSSELVGTTIGGNSVVRMIDEFPIFAVAAVHARGRTTVKDAGELRVKETDRISAVTSELKMLGARIEELPNGFSVTGGERLHGGHVDSHRDHRLAMALAVAGMLADGEVTVRDAEYAADSYPGFSDQLAELGGAR